MDYNQVKDLIKTINDSNITDFELTLNGATVKISKSNTTSIASSSVLPSVVEDVIKEVLDEPITIIPREKPMVVEGNIVKCPLVGTFYASSAPGKENYVSVGDKVKKGDTLCIIEAMKIMNEVTSAFDGEVVEILVQNEAMVEFNQPLFRIV